MTDTDALLGGDNDAAEPPANDKRPQASVRTLAGFWVSGLINNFGFVVMNTAATALIGDDLPLTTVSFFFVVRFFFVFFLSFRAQRNYK